MKLRLIILLLFISSICKGQAYFIATTAPTNFIITDSIRINLDTTISQPGWINIGGDPFLDSFPPVTGGVNNNIVLTVIKSNWSNYAGNCAFPSNGMAGGQVWPYAPNVMSESWYSYNNNGSNTDTFNVSKNKFLFSGLDTSSLYLLMVTNSLNSGSNGFSTSTEFRVIGAATYGPIVVNAALNISGVANFQPIKSDATGHFKIYVNAQKNQSMGVVSGFILYKLAVSSIYILTEGGSNILTELSQKIIEG